MNLTYGMLKKVWSGVRHSLPAVTWPPRVGPDAAPAPSPDAPPSAPPVTTPSAATVTEDSMTEAAAHLEYLGYQIEGQPDGWSLAKHLYRWDFNLCQSPCGIRLYCAVGIGASIGNSRGAWLEFLNAANDRSSVARFSLWEDEAGAHLIRIRAVIGGAYSRSVFAMAMDRWHDDLDIIRRKPEFPAENCTDEDEDVGVLTVN
jgi:hypothetical protein